VKVGVLGCGVISRQYATNASAFDSFELVACADLDPDAAEALAAEHGLTAVGVEELVADPAIELVLNLTPAAAHAAVNADLLAAGKHVYSEKPLAASAAEAAALLAEAERRGLRVGCAPDTFLSAAVQTARTLIDDGAIGEPLSVTAAMLVGGPTSWHPNPDIFFVDGAGPLLDMGPYYLTEIVALLGPVRRVSGFASTRIAEREIAVGPRAGERFRAHVATHTASVLELADGVTASLVASFEAPGQYACDLTIYGTEATLALPDPNGFDTTLGIRRSPRPWETVPVDSRGEQDARGLGLDDLVRAIEEGRAHRASGALAHHVVDVARTILAAAEAGRTLEVATTVERPEPLPVAIVRDR
jgi:predicted dehydrogenase